MSIKEQKTNSPKAAVSGTVEKLLPQRGATGNPSRKTRVEYLMIVGGEYSSSSLPSSIFEKYVWYLLYLLYLECRTRRISREVVVQRTRYGLHLSSVLVMTVV